MSRIPSIISDYAASDARDIARPVACCSNRAAVVDEGRTSEGRDEIHDWREGTPVAAARDVFAAARTASPTPAASVLVDGHGFVCSRPVVGDHARPFETSNPGVFAVGMSAPDRSNGSPLPSVEGSVVISSVHRHLSAADPAGYPPRDGAASAALFAGAAQE